MTEQQGFINPKQPIRIIDPRSYSTNRSNPSTYSLVQNQQQLSASKHLKESYKTIQQLNPSVKPQQMEQSYKQKIQQLQTRLGEQNKYLRETTESTFNKLQQANVTISKIKKQKEQLSKENRLLINKLQLQNISSKQLTDIIQKMRKENASLNLKVNSLNVNLNESKLSNAKQSEKEIKNLKKKISELEYTNQKLKKQIEIKITPNPSRINSRQRSPNLLYAPDRNAQSNCIGSGASQPSLKPNLTNSKTPSLERISAASRQNSLNSSQRSHSRSNFIQSELSPKQSARMQILFQQIGIIKKNLNNGGKLSNAIANKLFSLINHLTNALNRRNDQNVQLKSRLKQYQYMFVPNYRQRYPQTINQSLEIEHDQTRTTLRNSKHSFGSIEKPRSSLENYLHSPLKQDSINTCRQSSLKPNDSTSRHSRNQSLELNKTRYNYVYKRVALNEYLENKIELVSSMEIVTKITQSVEKQLISNPRTLTKNDFYVLYCEGECPNNLRIRVELKPRFQEGKVQPSSELQMMESLGCIFQQILRSIRIQSFADQKLFQKAVKPAFQSIINGLTAEKSKRMDMNQFKLLIQKLNY